MFTKELEIVQAVHKFDPEATSPNTNEKNLLPLEIGDKLIVLDKLSESQGWWKACDATQRIGYIPQNFVQVVGGSGGADDTEEGEST